MSAVYDAYIDRVDQLSILVDQGIESYNDLISGEYTFYFKKQDSYKYCLEDPSDLESEYKHHWYISSTYDAGLEYWYDMIKGTWVPLEMPLPFFIEMVCDRVAACRIYQKEKYTQKSALEYYYSRNDRFYMHEKTAAKLETVLKDIADHGEDAAFAHLKQELQEYRRTVEKNQK